MHDLDAVVRRAGRRPVQADGTAERAGPATVRPELDPLEAVFEQELASWLAQLYTARAEQRLVRVCGMGWLALMAAICAVPLLGAAAAVAALGLLVATLVLAFKTLDGWITSLDGVCPTTASGTPGQGGCPVFGPDERARLVRLMNLSRAARPLLQAELREARACQAFAQWRLLQDLESVLRADPFAFSVRSEERSRVSWVLPHWAP
jgi:hypothetical protein